MARSKYIYVAMDRYEGIIVVGTVKKEVIAKVRKQYAHVVVAIYRFGDCGDAEETLVDPKEWHIEKNQSNG